MKAVVIISMDGNKYLGYTIETDLPKHKIETNVKLFVIELLESDSILEHEGYRQIKRVLVFDSDYKVIDVRRNA